MDEFKKAVEAFLALPIEEQRRKIMEAGEAAKRISDDFDRKCRIDPLWLFQPMTI